MKKTALFTALVIFGILILWASITSILGTTDNNLRRAPIEPPPFEIVQFPPFELQGDMPCEEVLTKGKAYPAYKAILEALVAGTKPAEVRFLACFLPGWEALPDAEATRLAFTSEVFLSDVLYGFLARAFEGDLAYSLRMGVTKTWRNGRHGEAALLAYQKTGDTAYIDLYTHFFDRLMLLRDSELNYYDDWHETVMDSWGSYNLARGKHGHGNSWIAHVTLFSVVMVPATGFARVILTDPELSEYHEWADGVVQFFEQAYPQFDVDLRAVEGTNEQWYWRPVVQKFEALNHIHLLGQALLNMYAITGRPLYAERIEAILRAFEKTMKINDDGLASWNYSPYFQVESARDEKNTALYSEPTWKGSITVPFLYLAAEDGFTMSDGVLDAVTRSITQYILADAIPKLYTHPRESRSVKKQEIMNINKLRKNPENSELLKKPEAIEIMKLNNNFAGYYYAVKIAPEVSQQMLDYVANNPELLPRAWFTNHASVPGYAMSLP